MHKKHTRTILLTLIGLILASALLYAFWPSPMLVDIGQVRRDTLLVTIREEGRTRVHDAFVVSTTVAGRLLRIDVEPGDTVTQNETIVARMLPASPVALDLRTQEQAQAATNAANAALEASQAEFNMAEANFDLVIAEFERLTRLYERQLLSKAEIDRAQREVLSAQAARDSARAAISIRRAELANAQAQLIGFNDQGLLNLSDIDRADIIQLAAPASGRVLRVLQQSEVTLPVGTPIMEIGNIDRDLEIVVELLSTDAVQVNVGDRVIIDNWGGEGILDGTINRIDPFGFSKYSALGVEEQRVNAYVSFTEPTQKRENLGHGFRVEVQIVLSEEDDLPIVPANALFRQGDDWAVFAVVDGVAQRRTIEISRNNGIDASVLSGLEVGDEIVLYPAADLVDGARVAQRQAQ